MFLFLCSSYFISLCVSFCRKISLIVVPLSLCKVRFVLPSYYFSCSVLRLLSLLLLCCRVYISCPLPPRGSRDAGAASFSVVQIGRRRKCRPFHGLSVPFWLFRWWFEANISFHKKIALTKTSHLRRRIKCFPPSHRTHHRVARVLYYCCRFSPPLLRSNCSSTPLLSLPKMTP